MSGPRSSSSLTSSSPFANLGQDLLPLSDGQDETQKKTEEEPPVDVLEDFEETGVYEVPLNKHVSSLSRASGRFRPKP